MDGSRTSIRRAALARLAVLGDSNAVLREVPRAPRPYTSIRDHEVLLALCASAQTLQDVEHAEQLVAQLGAYLPEAHNQLVEPSPFLHEIKPSPWEILTSQLTTALLVLGLRFPMLQQTVKDKTSSYIQNWSKVSQSLARAITASDNATSTEDEAIQIAMLSVSLAGFMEAAAAHENLWTPYERLELTRSVREILSEQYLIALEKATSTIRHSALIDPMSRYWKRSLKHYAAIGLPLGAMRLQQGFIQLVLACTSRLLSSEEIAEKGDILERYMVSRHVDHLADDAVDDDMLEFLTSLITAQMNILEDGSDYLQLSSAWQQRLAFSVKAYALEAFLHCMILDEDIADSDVLLQWLEDTLDSQAQMAHLPLARVVLKSLAIIPKYVPGAAPNLPRMILKFIVQGTSSPASVDVAAASLAHILRALSQDAVITTLYSLGNVLSSQSGAEKQHQTGILGSDINGHHNSLSSATKERTGSVISLSWSGDEETSLVCGNVTRAIVTVAVTSKDNKIIALAQAMMIQKVGKIHAGVDAHIIEQSARLAIFGKENEMRMFLRLAARLHEAALKQNSQNIVEAIHKARQYLAEHIDEQSPLFKVFAVQLLERILNKGDIVDAAFDHSSEVEQAAREIGPLLKPLAILAGRQSARDPEAEDLDEDNEVETLSREAWFNVAVHGITRTSELGRKYHEELRLLAMYSPPLIDPERAELLESDVELNTVLRRGMSTQHASEQKRILLSIIPNNDADIRHLNYQKIVFLNAVYIVESLRAASGSCSEILQYFADPTLQHSHMGTCLSAIATLVVEEYIQRVRAARIDDYSAPYVSRQLAKVLAACCHRSAKLQEVARRTADTIIAYAPSALCQKSALFALMELLTLMWSSCLEAEIDEYDWKPVFASTRGKVAIEQSDDYAYRKRTLDLLHSNARRWMMDVIAIAPLDVKGLLQTYLSEYDDTGSYGHISLGRSFASEMGALIPTSDQRLGAIAKERQSANVNVASDFIAQYTTRQEYRFAGPAHDDYLHMKSKTTHNLTARSLVEPKVLEHISEEAQQSLAAIDQQLRHREAVPIADVKDVLRRAAALLCRSKVPQTNIVRLLVHIPFDKFEKESIKMGISLWLGVIHENPRMESRILTEVAQAWERTINQRLGIFSPRFRHPDPFYVKMEFAQTDGDHLRHQAALAQNTISPHLRVLQFFESHFNAIRLGSSNTQRTIVRMLFRTLEGFMHISGQPLLREIHFHVVLFALKVLHFSTCLNRTTQWRLRDKTLTTALRWFRHTPEWSFGGNRLQIKAEVKLMQDVLSALSSTRNIGSINYVNPRQNLEGKQQLLEALIHSEIARLQVWLQPISTPVAVGTNRDPQVMQFVRAAWAEDPALALQLLTRFPSSQLQQSVRFLLSNFPEKALNEANAIDLLLGDALPSDLSFQLKYLLYWSPVNPVQAVTYFMPAFGNHPFVIQYAMRALESHAVDVTFFYVPQIVQCLRYDALGYVERYIVETGSFSQLFAHQIIWNIKANAYKDEDSTIEDPVKPTLDKVMDSLISSFSGEDKDFYEREFAFFGEVTDISGKLKPFIKKSKPEKKAKIEEELRKIKVEVGVYLPSNPDGVVVGIDRKSGKPLQSHAKAPYMATFRIRKTRAETTEEIGDMVEDAAKHQTKKPAPHSRNSSSDLTNSGPIDDAYTYEVWQSAIFKVGDDCRQDVLALQMIAAFRGIFNSVGLGVYVFPYRVTATAPGCGVIDVLPNSISRDMLGREAVNGLYDYFVTKYGGEHSLRFQEARREFVKSMAAYSVISYLLQFKDRHNGNIMIDDKGHILHIDFGFCFDIAPGGVKFERAPFKLTPEMLAVMGGDDPATSQSYRLFEELTIKAFLCSRPYADKLSHLVTLMLDSGLPCFKPETIRNFQARFVLDKSEKDAAEFMRLCIKKSAGNLSTKVYDEFQLLTNGIPY